MKEEVLKIMSENEFCTISTVNSSGKPESALVGFSESDELRLVFGTSTKSRKYKNIKEQAQVAVVIGFERPSSIQYEGEARPLDDNEINDFLASHFKKLPSSAKYRQQADHAWLLIEPKWIRLTVRGTPIRVEEMRF